MPKLCSKCQESYPATLKYFTRKYTAKDGLYPTCRVCENKRHTQRYHDCKRNWLATHIKETITTETPSFTQYFL